MKKKFEFKDKSVAAEFERLSEQDVKDLAVKFFDYFGTPITKFAENVELSPGSVTLWLRGERDLGARSLARIYNFLRGANEKWNKYIDKINTEKNTSDIA